MDAILSLGVTDLINRVLDSHRSPTSSKLTADQLGRLDRHQRRDLLMLAACYDQSTEQPVRQRWKALARRLHYWTIKAQLPFWIGVATTLLVMYAVATLFSLADRNENVKQLIGADSDLGLSGRRAAGLVALVVETCDAIAVRRGLAPRACAC